MDASAKSDRAPRRKPETEAAKRRRLQNLGVQLADREHRAKTALAALTGALPRTRAHVTRLDRIADESHRLEVWRARVERLEALLDRTERKRETRAKIVLGATLLAEARANQDDPLMARLLDILDQRIDRPRDRLAIAETLGLPLAPLRGGEPPALPDFEQMAREVLEARPPTRRRRSGGRA